MTKDITQIYTKAIEAVDPSCAIQSHLKPSSIIIEQQHSSSPNKTINPLDYDGKIGMLNFIDPITSQPIHSYYEHHYDKIYIFAFGKASSAMATSAAGIISKAMPTIPIEGIVICKDDHGTNHEIQTLQSKFNIKVYYASHPIPDQRSVNASKAILNMIYQNNNNYESKKRTLIINCISGGGSSLFCSPREPLSIQDLAQTNNILLKSGMSINDMNIIRKRLENGKGGYLAAASYPCTSLTLVLSDVINDPLDIIASGPTVADDGSSWKEAWDLVLKFGLDGNNEMGGDDGCDFKLPDSVLSVLRDGLNGKLEDTPKSSHPVFRTNIIDHFLDDDWDEDHDDEKKSFAYCPTFDEQYSKTRTRYTKLSETMLVGNNYRAVLAAAQEAKHQGYNPIILGTSFEGEARYVAEMYINMASHLQRQRNFTSDLNESEDSLRNSFYMEKLPTALIAGGETTVTLKNHNAGKGGRNQELGLTAALKLRDKGLRDIVLASVGTDGTDGPTDAAGVIVDGGTVYRIEKSNGNEISGDLALENHDSYNFFSNVGQNEKSPLVKTGPTGTNVADICITLVM
jgi:glycerate-2-kinase